MARVVPGQLSNSFREDVERGDVGGAYCCGGEVGSGFGECALLHLQQFGDLFAVARRFRASRRAAAFGHSQTAETGTFRRARFKHGAHEFLGPPHAPGGCPVPRAAHGERVKTLIGISIPLP